MRENVIAANQLTNIFGLNRSHITPFELHYCNMNMGGIKEKHPNSHGKAIATDNPQTRYN